MGCTQLVMVWPGSLVGAHLEQKLDLELEVLLREHTAPDVGRERTRALGGDHALRVKPGQDDAAESAQVEDEAPVRIPHALADEQVSMQHSATVPLSPVPLSSPHGG
jgi:hypothetical protein